MNIHKIVRVSLLGAILCTSQIALSFIGNVELVSPLLLVMILCFNTEALYAIFVFVFLQGIMWGIGTWWFSYIYVWPVLYFLIVYLKRFNKENNFMFWSIILGMYGLFFGLLFALIYLPISLNYTLIYWVNGFYFDIVHAISNFTISIILCKPLYLTIETLKEKKIIKGL